MKFIRGWNHPCFLGTLSPNPWHFSLWANGMIDARGAFSHAWKTIAELRRLRLMLPPEIEFQMDLVALIAPFPLARAHCLSAFVVCPSLINPFNIVLLAKSAKCQGSGDGVPEARARLPWSEKYPLRFTKTPRSAARPRERATKAGDSR